jgi:lysophospholipase L1-like esterase
LILQGNALGISGEQNTEALPKGLKLQILPLGDSITYGIGSSKRNSYRKDLYDKLTADGASVQYLGSQKAGSFPQNANEGWSGFTITQISAKADRALQSQGRPAPNVVLLLAGTNDMVREPKGAPARLQTLAEKIVRSSPGAVLIVGTIPPLGGMFGSRGGNAKGGGVTAFNEAVPKVVKSVADKGGKVLLADLSAVTAGDLADGVHPNDKGYAKMAAGWYKAIEEAAAKGWIKS